jgi:ABC-type amino acid transport substrate-binding protein
MRYEVIPTGLPSVFGPVVESRPEVFDPGSRMTSRRHLPILLLALLLCLPLAARAQSGRTADREASFFITDEERAWLDAHQNLRLGMWLGAPPIVFRGADGAIQGMVPAYLDIVTRKLGLKPVRVRASSFTALWELAKAREVDMVGAMPGGMERSGDMLASEPYLLLPIVVATQSDHPFISGLDDLAGQVVAVTIGHVPHMRIPIDHPAIQLMPVASSEEGLQALVSGRAAAFVAGEVTISYLARELGISNIRIAAITEYSARLSIGVRKDWPQLLALSTEPWPPSPRKSARAFRTTGPCSTTASGWSGRGSGAWWAWWLAARCCCSPCSFCGTAA